jgi:hypothetical protein
MVGRSLALLTLALLSAAPAPALNAAAPALSDYLEEPLAFRGHAALSTGTAPSWSWIDLSFAYDANDSTLSADSVRAAVTPRVDYWNQILANNKVPGGVRLAEVVPIDLGTPARTAAGKVDSGALLQALLNDPTLSARRQALVSHKDAAGNEWGSDILLIGLNGLDRSGIAFLSTSAETAFGLVDMWDLSGVQDLLAHEGGHILGLRHCPASAGDPGPYTSLGDEGFCGTTPDGTTFRTVMGYITDCTGGCSIEVPFYSAADQTAVVNGTTVKIGKTDESDAKRVLATTFVQVANYRHSLLPDCTPSATALCLNGGRFRVEVTWKTPKGQTGSGQGVALTAESGYFWFFDASNIELMVKVLDGCPVTNHFWVFAGGLTNVEVVLTVTDTVTGTQRVYHNPLNTVFKTVTDTGAFATCL